MTFRVEGIDALPTAPSYVPRVRHESVAQLLGSAVSEMPPATTTELESQIVADELAESDLAVAGQLTGGEHEDDDTLPIFLSFREASAHPWLRQPIPFGADILPPASRTLSHSKRRIRLAVALVAAVGTALYVAQGSGSPVAQPGVTTSGQKAPSAAVPGPRASAATSEGAGSTPAARPSTAASLPAFLPLLPIPEKLGDCSKPTVMSVAAAARVAVGVTLKNGKPSTLESDSGQLPVASLYGLLGSASCGTSAAVTATPNSYVVDLSAFRTQVYLSKLGSGSTQTQETIDNLTKTARALAADAKYSPAEVSFIHSIWKGGANNALYQTSADLSFHLSVFQQIDKFCGSRLLATEEAEISSELRAVSKNPKVPIVFENGLPTNANSFQASTSTIKTMPNVTVVDPNVQCQILNAAGAAP